jgi:hypothetical protein
MNQFFTDGKLNENSLRNEVLKLTGVYCNLNSIPVPNACKEVLDNSTSEELLEAEIKLVESEYKLGE